VLHDNPFTRKSRTFHDGVIIMRRLETRLQKSRELPARWTNGTKGMEGLTMKHDHDSQHKGSNAPAAVVEVDIKNAYSGSDYASLETCFRKLSGVTGAHLDRTRGVAHLSYDPALTTPEMLEDQLRRCGYECDCTPRVGSKSHPGHPRVDGHDHAAMDHGGAPAKTAGDAHAGHEEHAGHGAEMVGDLLRRFIVSLVLSLPLFIFSHVGALVGLHLSPPFGLSLGLFGFLLATPVVWWGGWPFISAAWRALRRGEVNMMTLIALGILVSYTYSVAATFLFEGEVVYEAAATLTTFSLAGHWMEMRSRFATGKAVEALLKLAPTTARVKRQGIEKELPIEEIVVSEEIVVRPGELLMR
jgi:P-type Cu2+ transporter